MSASFNIDSLLKHLEGSGTGKAKLAALSDLAQRCESFADFTKLANTVISNGTLDKVEAYYAANPPKQSKRNEPAQVV